MNKIALGTLAALLAMQVSFFVSPLAARADEMTCPPPTPVTIDIKPGNAQNKIKLSANGVLTVAVLTTVDFDASQFTPETAHLNDASLAATAGCTGAAALRWTVEDENGDGRADLVFFFSIRDLNLTVSSTAATLMAHGTYAGSEMHIEGSDAVKVVP